MGFCDCCSYRPKASTPARAIAVKITRNSNAPIRRMPSGRKTSTKTNPERSSNVQNAVRWNRIARFRLKSKIPAMSRAKAIPPSMKQPIRLMLLILWSPSGSGSRRSARLPTKLNKNRQPSRASEKMSHPSPSPFLFGAEYGRLFITFQAHFPPDSDAGDKHQQGKNHFGDDGFDQLSDVIAGNVRQFTVVTDLFGGSV